jgi:hypothetical protein
MVYRLEVDVLRYNTAALEAVRNVADVHVCDLHKIITDHCGANYSTCDIAQCRGPHFVGDGFEMLGEAVAKCVQTAMDTRWSPMFN